MYHHLSALSSISNEPPDDLLLLLLLLLLTGLLRTSQAGDSDDAGTAGREGGFETEILTRHSTLEQPSWRSRSEIFEELPANSSWPLKL
jgi:hypothetical protein